MAAREFHMSQNVIVTDVQSVILNYQGKLCSKSVKRRQESINFRKNFYQK